MTHRRKRHHDDHRDTLRQWMEEGDPKVKVVKALEDIDEKSSAIEIDSRERECRC